jgi:hypothetical protein
MTLDASSAMIKEPRRLNHCSRYTAPTTHTWNLCWWILFYTDISISTQLWAIMRTVKVAPLQEKPNAQIPATHSASNNAWKLAGNEFQRNAWKLDGNERKFEENLTSSPISSSPSGEEVQICARFQTSQSFSWGKECTRKDSHHYTGLVSSETQVVIVMDMTNRNHRRSCGAVVAVVFITITT